MTNKSDPFKTVKRLLWVENYMREISNIDLFNFTEVETDNLNRMSINHVVEDITFTDYIVKLKHQDNNWV